MKASPAAIAGIALALLISNLIQPTAASAQATTSSFSTTARGRIDNTTLYELGWAANIDATEGDHHEESTGDVLVMPFSSSETVDFGGAGSYRNKRAYLRFDLSSIFTANLTAVRLTFRNCRALTRLVSVDASWGIYAFTPGESIDVSDYSAFGAEPLGNYSYIASNQDNYSSCRGDIQQVTFTQAGIDYVQSAMSRGGSLLLGLVSQKDVNRQPPEFNDQLSYGIDEITLEVEHDGNVPLVDWDVPYLTQAYYRNWTTACMPTSGAMVFNFLYGHAFEPSGTTWEATPVDGSFRTSGQRLYAKGTIDGQGGPQVPLLEYLREWPKNGVGQYYGDWTDGWGPGGAEKFSGPSLTPTSMNSPPYAIGYTGGVYQTLRAILEKHGIYSKLLQGSSLDETPLSIAIESGPIILSTSLLGGHVVVVKGKTSNGNFLIHDPWGNNLPVSSVPNPDGADVQYSYSHLNCGGRWGILVPIAENYDPSHPLHDTFSPFNLYRDSDLDFRYDHTGQLETGYDGNGRDDLPTEFSYRAFDANGEIAPTTGWDYSYTCIASQPKIGAFPICKTSGDVGTITNQASWESTVLVDGRYELSTGFWAMSDNSTQAPHGIYVDDVLKYERIVDQSPPSGTDPSFRWAELHGGLVLRAGQNLRIVVANNTDELDPQKDINVDVTKAVYQGPPGLDLVGSFADGWHFDGSSQAILDAWLRNGGRAALGDPVDAGGGTTVHAYSFATLNGSNTEVLLQDFARADGDATTLCYVPSAGRAFLLKGCLGYLWWQPVIALGDPQTRYQNVLGAPSSDEVDDSPDLPEGFVVMQSFQHGTMFWKDGTVRVDLDGEDACEDPCNEIDVCSSSTPGAFSLAKSVTSCPLLLTTSSAAKVLWDFDDAGTQDWTPRNAMDTGIDSGEYWVVDPTPDPASKSGIISPPLLSAVHTDTYQEIEVRAGAQSEFLATLEAHVRIDDLWQTPIVLDYVSGEQAPGAFCVYRGTIPYVGQIRQLRVDFLWGSAATGDQVLVDYVGFVESSAASTVYVSTWGRDLPDQGTALQPYRTLQYSLSKVREGGTVHVAAGTYLECIDLGTKNVSLVGEDREVTILDGNRSGTVLTIAGGQDSTTEIRGLTIRGGSYSYSYDGGGGITCAGSSPRIVDCLITQNGAMYGAGVHFRGGADATMESCWVTDNSSALISWPWDDAGPLTGLSGGSRDDVERVVSKRLAERGGGIFCTGSSPALRNLVISGNEASSGGGINVRENSAPHISHSLIVGNHAWGQGGGLTSEGGAAPFLENCTFSDNESGLPGGALWCALEGSIQAVNSIFWGNVPDEFCFGPVYPDIIDCVESSKLSLDASYSDIAGGFDGPGNIDLDPLFMNPALGDYSLQPGSPCLDSGDPASPDDPDGTRADMGTGGSTQIPTAVGDGAPWPIPSRNALQWASPNPFNPHTKIDFELRRSGATTLSIYDLSGRLVRVLVRNTLSVGPHSVTWNGEDDSGRRVASGVYLYQLRAGDFVETKRMVLLK